MAVRFLSIGHRGGLPPRTVTAARLPDTRRRARREDQRVSSSTRSPSASTWSVETVWPDCLTDSPHTRAPVSRRARSPWTGARQVVDGRPASHPQPDPLPP